MMITESKGRILFVSPDQIIYELLICVFKAAGYEAIHARSVEEGIISIKETRFEMIILNWLFEDGTGLDLCRAIRRIAKETPILFYTDESQPPDVAQAIQAGAQGFFTRPVDLGTFLPKSKSI